MQKRSKVIKVPNSNVFGIASSFLLAKGISRIISETKADIPLKLFFKGIIN